MPALRLEAVPEANPPPQYSRYDYFRLPRARPQVSGLPFCRAFVVMNFLSEGVDFVMDFCLKFFCVFLGTFRPFERRTENPQRHPQQNHDKITAKSTHVVKNGVGKSTLQEEGPDKVLEKYQKILGSARIKGAQTMKTSLPPSRLIKVLYPRGENCFQNAHFYKQKRSS